MLPSIIPSPAKVKTCCNAPGIRGTRAIVATLEPRDQQAFHAAFNWLAGGATSVFIQGANSLIIKPADLVDILTYLKARFPWVERIASYARAHTLARIEDDDLKAIGDAGLNRIHTGLESGSDNVLALVKKGATKEIQIKAGLKVKRAGIELSEYYTIYRVWEGGRFSKSTPI